MKILTKAIAIIFNYTDEKYVAKYIKIFMKCTYLVKFKWEMGRKISRHNNKCILSSDGKRNLMDILYTNKYSKWNITNYTLQNKYLQGMLYLLEKYGKVMIKCCTNDRIYTLLSIIKKKYKHKNIDAIFTILNYEPIVEKCQCDYYLYTKYKNVVYHIINMECIDMCKIIVLNEVIRQNIWKRIRWLANECTVCFQNVAYYRKYNATKKTYNYIYNTLIHKIIIAKTKIFSKIKMINKLLKL